MSRNISDHLKKVRTTAEACGESITSLVAGATGKYSGKIALLTAGKDKNKFTKAGAGILCMALTVFTLVGAGMDGPVVFTDVADDPLTSEIYVATEGTVYSIQVDGAEVVNLPTKTMAEKALEQVIARYTTSGAQVESANYQEDVQVVAKNWEGTRPETKSIEDAVSFIVTGTQEATTYTAQEGDTFWSIAEKTGVSSTKLMEMNPSIGEKTLQVGDVVNLYQIKPFLHVETVEKVTKTVAIAYDVEYEKTSSLYKGEKKVKSAGVNGSKEVVCQVSKVNGQVTSETELSSTVITEPTAEVVLAGTAKAPSYYVASASRGGGSGNLGSPLSGYQVSSVFGASRGGGSRSHTGVDLRAPHGSAIYAMAAGTVTYAGYKGSYGNLVKISHGGGLETWYAHCDTLSVSAGSSVSKGQKIATVGITGTATGYHLHLEVRVNGTPKNPLNYF